MLDGELLGDVDEPNAPWTWDDGAPKGALTAAAPAAGLVGEADEDSILAALAAIDFEALKDEDVEQRELASMVVDALGDDLDMVAAGDEGPEVAPAVGLSDVSGGLLFGARGGALRQAAGLWHTHVGFSGACCFGLAAL